MKKVEAKIRIEDVSPKKVINAFTEADQLREWWDVERCYIEKQKGGIYTLAWNISDKGFGYVSTGIVDDYSSSGILKIEKFMYLNPKRPILGPMTLAIKAGEKEGITELFLCQDGFRSGPDWDWYYEAVKDAWPLALKKLKVFLESE